MVEAALVDAAARVFLDQLGQPGPSPDAAQDHAAPASPRPTDVVVEQAAIDACVRAFRGLDDMPPPDLVRDLDDERIWVLLDLARNGSGLTRQRATLELRATLRELSTRPNRRTALLRALTRELRHALSGSFPVVFRAFLLEAEAGLRRLTPGKLGPGSSVSHRKGRR